MAEEMETNIAETTTTAEVPDTQEGRMQVTWNSVNILARNCSLKFFKN